MMIDRVLDEYYDWMMEKIDYPGRRHHKKILNHLYHSPFIAIMDMDVNREQDGFDLIRQFGYEKDYDVTQVEEYLSNEACSILEMMIALSIRCEDAIMSNDKFGNRTAYWFWTMFSSLGLNHYTDDKNFHPNEVDDILNAFIQRRYGRDGKGGLFYIPRCKQDMRKLDIWYQMMAYLETVPE